jgi:hypothetical protein
VSRVTGALALAVLLAAPGLAREVWRSGERVVEVSGSVREVLTGTDGTDQQSFDAVFAADPACADVAAFASGRAFVVVGDEDVWTSLTRARVSIAARAGPHWSAALSYDHEIRAGTLDTWENAFSSEPDTLLDLEDDIEAFGLDPHAAHFRWRHRLYRGWIHYEDQHFQVTVGRQRLAWGTGRLWNPIDRLAAIGPLAIEGDEYPGVDAVELRWMWSGFDYVQLVAAPGDHARDSRYALRVHGALGNEDISLLAGLFEQAFAVGADYAGNAGGAAWRMEAIWTNPSRDVWKLGQPAPRELSPFWQVVVSLDGTLDIGPGLYVLVEHLFDGNALGFGRGRAGVLLPWFGERASSAAPAGALPVPIGRERFAGSRVVSLARNTTGVQWGIDVTPQVRADFLILYDWSGGSAAFAPTLAYAGWNDIELRVGVQGFAGPRRSQFGPQQTLGFAVLEWFF